MTISVVICTRNRAEQLALALQSWLQVDFAYPWELIVVDNGSTDHTWQIIEYFREQFGQRLLSITELQKGLGNARDLGSKLAQGEIVVFTDDDCYPDKNFLEDIKLCFDEDPRLGFLGGRVLLFDPTDFPITIQEQTTREALNPGSFIPAGLIQGANFACRKEALDSINGFDGRLGAGTPFPCEDVDTLARLSAKGWHGAYDPRPLVYHHHRRKTLQDVKRLLVQYDYGRGAYYVKCLMNPRLRWVYLLRWLSFIPRQHPQKTLRELFSGGSYLWQSWQPGRPVQETNRF